MLRVRKLLRRRGIYKCKKLPERVRESYPENGCRDFCAMRRKILPEMPAFGQARASSRAVTEI
jgi:hypothetical protein